MQLVKMTLVWFSVHIRKILQFSFQFSKINCGFILWFVFSYSVLFNVYALTECFPVYCFLNLDQLIVSKSYSELEVQR